MKYEDFDKYCGWLFAVLGEVEPLIPYQHYNTYQKRVIGFMAERLLNVYVRKNKLKVSYSSVYAYGKDLKHQGLLSKCGSVILNGIRFLRNSFAYIAFVIATRDFRAIFSRYFSRH